MSEDTFVWGGLFAEDVSSEEDCETLCLDNVCEVANYVASTSLCFYALTAKTTRRINTDASLGISGGLCDVSFSIFYSKIYVRIRVKDNQGKKIVKLIV